ncbi:hypothetical protein GCM10023201_41310 [Actinomycetospora corticicola]|uniref:Uncharacterized protein n=1 Tax=Actinomycetospora corticicola TaxID=663602 RepID=A0A7Y9DX32_9PSEU|nr:hypothetical protein [Actinomycetospora corticicola]NYD36782.1 hypothetical protein [Actinomycetospora corticicola]
MRDHVRAQQYRDHRLVAGFQRLEVAETRPGDSGVQLALGDSLVVLDAETVERLGIDLQIRASYLRGIRPPPGPEPDRAPGPDDVPLIEETQA